MSEDFRLDKIEESVDGITVKYMLTWGSPRRLPADTEIVGIMHTINPNAGFEIIRHTNCSLWFKVLKPIGEPTLHELRRRLERHARPGIAA